MKIKKISIKMKLLFKKVYTLIILQNNDKNIKKSIYMQILHRQNLNINLQNLIKL